MLYVIHMHRSRSAAVSQGFDAITLMPLCQRSHSFLSGQVRKTGPMCSRSFSESRTRVLQPFLKGTSISFVVSMYSTTATASLRLYTLCGISRLPATGLKTCYTDTATATATDTDTDTNTDAILCYTIWTLILPFTKRQTLYTGFPVLLDVL